MMNGNATIADARTIGMMKRAKAVVHQDRLSTIDVGGRAKNERLRLQLHDRANGGRRMP
jgi:hypothetical protein